MNHKFKKNFQLNRKIINIIRYILENIIPPFIRDSRIFILIMFLIYRKNTSKFINFRNNVLTMTPDEYAEYYIEASKSTIQIKSILGETDLNTSCIQSILNNIQGSSVADIGCGRGFLVNKIASHFPKIQIIGIDLEVNNCKTSYQNAVFAKGWIENIPLESNSIDTVVCTHVLEHVIDIKKALNELRRIAKKTLIIVVPREREYRYTFNFHVHFFPYISSFLNRIIPPPTGFFCQVLDGDIFYVENYDLENTHHIDSIINNKTKLISQY